MGQTSVEFGAKRLLMRVSECCRMKNLGPEMTVRGGRPGRKSAEVCGAVDKRENDVRRIFVVRHEEPQKVFPRGLRLDGCGNC